MKATHRTILVFAMATVMLLATPLLCGAVEEEEIVRLEGRSERGLRRWELTEESVKRIMNRLKQTKPEEAEELAQLREKDPEKFKAELRKLMREQFARRFREQREQRAERGHWRPGAGEHPARGMRMRERHAEYLEWLEKNYPEKAEKLAKLKEEKPELYMRKLALGYKKYSRIVEAAKDNPELAEVLKERLEVNRERDKLVRKIKAATDEREKEKLIEELGDVLNRKFDLIVRRKQIAYEQLLKKLEELKEEVKKSEANVEKWKDPKFKKENVRKHLEEVIGKTEKFRWD